VTHSLLLFNSLDDDVPRHTRERGMDGWMDGCKRRKKGKVNVRMTENEEQQSDAEAAGSEAVLTC